MARKVKRLTPEEELIGYKKEFDEILARLSRLKDWQAREIPRYFHEEIERYYEIGLGLQSVLDGLVGEVSETEGR